jgi:protoporphyrinogen oxidase
MSYEFFDSSVGQILRNEYGSHLFEKFIKVLSDDIGLNEK